MTDSADYRLYLTEKFKDLHDEMKTQFTGVNGQLRDVNDHLAMLNHKVAKHEKAIGEICSFKQWEQDADERKRIAAELKATQRRDIRFVIFNVIALICTVFGVFWMLYKSNDMQTNVKEIKSETKVTNDILYDAKTRGKCYTPPIFRNDTIQ